jgi:hypothetical protein
MPTMRRTVAILTVFTMAVMASPVPIRVNSKDPSTADSESSTTEAIRGGERR